MFQYNYGLLPESFIGTWIRNDEYYDYDLALRNINDLHIPRFKYVYLSKHPLFHFLKYETISAKNSRQLFH